MFGTETSLRATTARQYQGGSTVNKHFASHNQPSPEWRGSRNSIKILTPTRILYIQIDMVHLPRLPVDSARADKRTATSRKPSLFSLEFSKMSTEPKATS